MQGLTRVGDRLVPFAQHAVSDGEFSKDIEDIVIMGIEAEGELEMGDALTRCIRGDPAASNFGVAKRQAWIEPYRLLE